MSKFFRSLDSDSSDDSSSDEHEEPPHGSPGVAAFVEQDDTDSTHDVSTTFNSLSLLSQSEQGGHRDLLLHALLEERCLNEVLQERHSNGQRRATKNDASVQSEARARYHRLCGILAPHNLISSGLEHDHLTATRQRYRDGLDLVSQSSFPAPAAQSSVPAPLRRLITDSSTQSGGLQSWPWTPSSVPPALDAITPSHPVLEPSRYVRDFDELGMLGKGGYGMVFHVRNKLDDLQYAVKKVPISPARFMRIQARGQSELDDLLRELRTLARLDHPNIVRYHAGWIEWSDVGRASPTSATGLGESVSYVEEESAKAGAEDDRTESLRRVFTESDSLENDIMFESSQSQQPSRVSRSGTEELSNALNESVTDGALVRTSEPTLALHLQMGLYPLTLADFISPAKHSDEDVAPLTHCFHLQPSIDILLAVLEGVEYLHAEGIVHRDLKPANIFMGANSNPRSTRGSVDLFLCERCRTEGIANPVKLNVRIGDFGLVTALGPEAGEVEQSPRPAVGTEIYRPLNSMSNASPGLDVFALGIVAFEMLWKFGTRMERHDTIQQLKRGYFPAQFSERIGDKTGEVENLISDMLLHQNDKASINALKRRLSELQRTCK